MSAFQVEPAELVERSHQVTAVAARLRDGAVAVDRLRGGRELQGGLEAALTTFVDRWRGGHHVLADRADRLAGGLGRAADVYTEVDLAVLRASRAQGDLRTPGN